MSTTYFVACAHDSTQLEESVDGMLSDGWRPCGGLVVVPDAEMSGKLLYAQALVKHVPHEEEV